MRNTIGGNMKNVTPDYIAKLAYQNEVMLEALRATLEQYQDSLGWSHAAKIAKEALDSLELNNVA